MKNFTVYLALLLAVIAFIAVKFSVNSSYSKTEIHTGPIKTTCYDKDGKVMPGNISISDCLTYHSKLLN